jgi:hypothetical protein
MDIAFERVSTWRYWTDHQVEEKRGKRRGGERERCEDVYMGSSVC